MTRLSKLQRRTLHWQALPRLQVFLARTVAQLQFRYVILVLRLRLSNKCLSVSPLPRKVILPHVGKANPLRRVTCLARANLVKVFLREVHLRHSKLSRPLEGSSTRPLDVFLLFYISLIGPCLLPLTLTFPFIFFVYGLFSVV